MQEGGNFGVPLSVGSGGASTSSAQAAPITSKVSSSASADQGTLLTARGGASTCLVQGISMPPRGTMPTSAFQVASHSTTRAVASTSGFQGALCSSRQRFYVELKDGETNVVSWKKLLKDAQKNAPPIILEAPAGANPALEARFGPERAGSVQTNMATVQDALPPPPNRFSSVIEKIERLYKGVDSEEEDAGASPDDSHYDTEDDFIDDTELNEYFSVEKAKTKHTGFFVNRGKLEKVDESPPPSPVHVPRKRKRKDVAKRSGEMAAEEFAKKRVNTGLRLKDAARKTSVTCTTAGVEAGPSTLLRSSEQPLVPKPKKRVKPLLEERDKDVEPIPVMSHDHSSKENFRDTGKVEDMKKQSVNKIQTTVVELSDDENDEVLVVQPEVDGKERGSSDVAILKRQAMKRTEDSEASGDERNNMSKSAKACVEEKLVRDVLKESRVPVAPPKVRKNQQLSKDDESKDTEGSGKTLSGFLEASPKKYAGWPKGTVLERAIHDLERGVAEAFPLTGDRQAAIDKAEAGGKSKRLPREIKQKLAKVARLAAKKGKISDELIDRLMNIIGHVMRLKTLKRNLKSMVEMGLNAKQEKDVRLQDMKREVTELVKSRVSTSMALDAEEREGSSDDFQATQGSTEKGMISGRYKWDQTTEDRICDLYDHYVEGMDEHKGPQIRKLYMELAELWPDGWMDNNGIKSAVFRAKERRKKQNKTKKGEEKRGRKPVAVTDNKPRGDREMVLTEKRLSTTPALASVAPIVKGVPEGLQPTKITVHVTKEKLTIKSSKQRVDETSKRQDERSKRTEDGQQRYIEEEQARRIAVEAASRHAADLMRKPLVDPMRENGTSDSNLVRVKTILRKNESTKVKRTEDGVKVKRKLPRKSFEGKIVELVGKKRHRNESVELESLETLRSSKNSLNSPLLKVKKKKMRASSDGSSPSLRASLSQNPSQSMIEKVANGSHISQSRLSGISSLKSAEPAPLRGMESDRVRDAARLPSEASRLLNG